MIKSIAVFCGSSIGKNPVYKQAAVELGYLLAKNNITMVYGGGNIGMMGAIADAVLEKKGKVIGVIPTSLLEKEIAHPGVSEMHQVENLMQRKTKMIELSDAFVALPGGFGTLDEFFEIATLLQLGYLKIPTALLNVNGYFDDLVAMMNKSVKEQFIKPVHRENILVSDTVPEMLEQLNTFIPTDNDPKWIDNLKKENRYL
ncbi:MAG: TIGR00730 family Rossman fold protein [Bacteroidota bacterium]